MTKMVSKVIRISYNYDCDKNIRNGWIGIQLPQYLKKLDLNFEIETRVVILPQDLAYYVLYWSYMRKL